MVVAISVNLQRLTLNRSLKEMGDRQEMPVLEGENVAAGNQVLDDAYIGIQNTITRPSRRIQEECWDHRETSGSE